MFGLFTSSKTTKVEGKQFSAFLGGMHFAAQSLQDEPMLDAVVNLKGVLYMRGDQEIVVTQNESVLGERNELQIDRVTGAISDQIESSLL